MDTNKKLAKLKNKVAKPKYFGYMPVLMIIIIAVHILDEICGIINNDMQNSVVNEFIAIPQGIPYNIALSKFGGITTVFALFIVVAPFYKSLADRFGRKPFLICNTVGMGLGLMLCCWSPNFVVYCIGFALVSFFIVHDMQVIYIFEVAPKDKRARFYGITKCVGTLGMVIVPILRDFLMKDDGSKWRNVFIIPFAFAFVLAAVILIFARESDIFLNNRIKSLENPQLEKIEKENEQKEKVGVIPAIKYIFKHKDLRWLVLSHMVYGVGFMAISRDYQSVMSEGYGMSPANVTKALYLFPFVFAAVILIFGFLGDKFGRKNVVVLNASMTVVSLILFNVCAYKNVNPYVVGLFCALSRSCMYNGYDYISMMAAEKAPTEIRNSVLGAESLLAYVGTGVGMGVLFLLYFLSSKIGLMGILVTVPPLIAAIFMLIFKVKESNGANLETVGVAAE